MTLGSSGGISPIHTNADFVCDDFIHDESGLAKLGAVDGQIDEEDFEELVAGGAVEGGAGRSSGNQRGSESADGHGGGDQEGQEAVARRAPVKPSPEEVERHNLTHIPRRMWCKICAEAALKEDPHRRSGVDHKVTGIPEVHMDYKELRKGSRPILVMRERASGATVGIRSMGY